jgi:hypothetical protein
MPARVSAARAAGVRTVFAAPGAGDTGGVRIVPVRHVKDALTWAEASRRHVVPTGGLRSTAVGRPPNGPREPTENAL